MLKVLDGAMANITATLKARGLWENTLGKARMAAR